ncbi:MAG: V-type ATP synthase subunit C [Gammaproteobacteria bacterium]
MPAAVKRYAYLNARISGMAQRLLPPETIDALIDRETSHTVLGELIPELEPLKDTAMPDSRFLESALLLALLEEFAVLSRTTHGAARQLLMHWIRRFELANLKTLIRGKVARRPAVTIRNELIELGSFATLPVDRLLAAEDVPELLRQLENSSYHAIVTQARLAFEEQQELFILDATLDQRYFSVLAQQINAFSGDERRWLERLVGSYIDQVNLVWLLRYRFAYGLPPAQAYYLLASGGHRIVARDWLRLVELQSQAAVIAALPDPLAERLRGATTISEVNRRMESETAGVAEQVLHHGFFTLARALAYLLLRELRIQQMLAVLKGREMNLHPALIRFAAGFGELPPEGWRHV